MSEKTLVSPEALDRQAALAGKLLDELDRILLGRRELHRMVLVGILSQGHILLEGLPGLGKTALVKALGDLLGLTFKRVQFTPDLMPGDILGTHILQPRQDGKREMTFEPGPIFSHILLADEINRASPKTQSAMLEAMQERHVTLLGETRALPQPFFVLASQNPIELEGTYPLPEAQLDRFLLKLKVGDIAAEVLEAIIAQRRRGEPPKPGWQLSREELQGLFEVMDHIYLPGPVAHYISRLTAATHRGAVHATALVEQYVSYGSSPRGAIGLAEAARAYALLAGRASVGFEDVKACAAGVLNHRILLNYKARFDKIDSYAIIADLLEKVADAEVDLPRDIRLEARGE